MTATTATGARRQLGPQRRQRPVSRRVETASSACAAGSRSSVLLITVVPFYYMFVLSAAPDRGAAAATRRAVGQLVGRSLLDAYRRCSSPADGGQGFLEFLRNSAGRRSTTVVLTLLVSILGAYAIARLRFFGRGQISLLFLAVYLFPPIAAGRPAVRRLHLARPARVPGRPDARLHRADRAGVGLHAARLLRDHPGQPRGGGRRRRLQPAARLIAGSPCRCPCRDHGDRAVRLHDRLERVPVRAAVPWSSGETAGPCRWA